MLTSEATLRIVGVHDGLTAVLAERAGFRALWLSGLGVSASAGVPDAGVVTYREMLDKLREVRRVCSLPVIVDGDSGYGDPNLVRRVSGDFAEARAAALCIEDKAFPKRNSFRGSQVLESADVFCRKLEAARSTAGEEMLVVARLEGFIAGAPLHDTLQRATRYVEAGADALLVHSRRADSSEIELFCEHYATHAVQVPLLVVPTTYHSVTSRKLGQLGVSGVIWANQLLRAGISAMESTLGSLQAVDSAAEVEPVLCTLERVFDLTRMADLESDIPMQAAERSIRTLTQS